MGLLLQDLIPLSACSDPSTWRLTPYASYLLWGRCLFISVSVSACIEKESTQSCCPGNDFEETHKVQYYWSRLQSIIIIISNLVDCVCVYVEWILFLFLANQYHRISQWHLPSSTLRRCEWSFIAPRGKVHVRRAHRKLEWLGGVLTLTLHIWTSPKATISNHDVTQKGGTPVWRDQCVSSRICLT